METARSTRRYPVDRSPRWRGSPGGFAQYLPQARGRQVKTLTAQFTDVSATGMQLISRMATSVDVGESLSIEFSLPDGDTFKHQALIVRKMNEFIFAVRFISMSASQRKYLESAIADQMRSTPLIEIEKRVAPVAEFIERHRDGLVVALVALFAIASIGTWIFLHSDEHLGRALRSWSPRVSSQADDLASRPW